MSPIVILSGSKLLATCLAASLARIGAPTQAFDQANSALDALRRLASGILLLHPKSGRAIDLTPMRRLAESQTSVRCILLTDAEIERVANATAGLPPHCRVSLDADLDHLVTCIREGRSREWGSSTKAWRPSDDVGGEVKLPDGVVLTPAQADVLREHCRGKSAVQIAVLRGGSSRTVESHMRAVRGRTGINNNVELAVRYSGWALRAQGEP
ncbi:MAG TPA: LuxR C-terminal-related transcriptional regulator [Gemmatimonadales bacterium]|nr:LuxR C-terminal-related transcriptional regulator [Gemmatimonadales bacterium]